MKKEIKVTQMTTPEDNDCYIPWCEDDPRYGEAKIALERWDAMTDQERREERERFNREAVAAEEARWDAMTDQERREEYIEETFRSIYSGGRHSVKHEKYNFLNSFHEDWSSEEVENNIKLLFELTDQCYKIPGILNGIKLMESLNAPDIIVDPRRRFLADQRAKLETLLRSKPHRDAVRYVMVKLLDKSKLIDHRVNEGGRRHESLYGVLEMLSQKYINAGVPVPTHLNMPEPSFRRKKRNRKRKKA